ncbi:hypothetical protein AaE_015114 [Aphanomyces astaci]|uniref:Uncharacterized protein n=1 Tax=Aphanomyces astaci TaxID=112090 RepID=A0A6A4Z0V1_APHAT|nr:hypothetical protein AaE_015114 [Aphanomyces astaci]
MEEAIPAPQTPPPRRGPYKRIPLSAKRRVVAAHDAGQDWKSVARANGINESTAKGWLMLDSLTPKQRGGYKPRRLSPQLVDTMEAWVECDCQSTFAELKARIQVDYDIVVSETTIHRAGGACLHLQTPPLRGTAVQR